MSQSSEPILDHIADYLPQLFWFMLNTSYDHGCHLASQFRLETNEYKVLLVVAGLAHYTWFGFAMKPTAWRKFLGGHQFASDDCAMLFDQKKIDLDAYINGTPPLQLKRMKFYVVRIGNKTKQLPNKLDEQMGQDGGLITPPPHDWTESESKHKHFKE